MREIALSKLIKDVKSLSKQVNILEAKHKENLADLKEIKDYIETHIRQTWRRVKK